MSKLKSILALTAASFALAASPALASEDTPNAYVGITSGGPIGAQDRVASDESRKSVTTAQISNENEVLSANFALDLTVAGKVKQTRQNGLLYYTSSLSNVSVKASVPLNPSKAGSLVDFKTFGNDGKLTLGFNVYRSKLLAPSAGRISYALFAKSCIAEAGKEWRKDVKVSSRPDIDSQIEAVIARFGNEIDARLPVDTALYFAAKATPDDGFGPFALSVCKVQGTAGVGNDDEYATKFGEKALGKEGYAAWRQKYFNPQNTFFYGAEASIGYNRFSVADRTTVTVGVKDRVGFDVSGRAGWVFGADGMVLLASGGYTRSYKAKADVEVCGPPDLSGKTICVKGQDGLPDKSETAYATVSLRKVLLRNKNGQPIVGIRPSATYVVEDKDWQFELPVYLQRSDTGGLDAGVRGIYNTGSKKFGIGAFVGVPF